MVLPVGGCGGVYACMHLCMHFNTHTQDCIISIMQNHLFAARIYNVKCTKFCYTQSNI